MRKKSLLDALFPRTRQALLSALLSHRARRWYLSDLASHLNLRPSSLQRELAALTDAGLLKREKEGNRVYYQVNAEFPLLLELQSIFIKTTGVADKLKEVLKPFWDRIAVAYIFGSIARNERGAHSDIDLMLIGDLKMSTLALPFRKAESELGAEINAALYTEAEYQDKVNQGKHFLKTVHDGQKIFLKGTEIELEYLTGERERSGAQYEQERTG